LNTTNLIQATLYRTSGSIVTSEISFVINDSEKPTLAITNPPAQVVIANTNIYDVVGIADDNLTGINYIKILNNGSVIDYININNLPNWNYYFNLNVGSNFISVIAEDFAGNTNSDSTLILYNGNADISINIPSSEKTFITNINSLSIGGNASDENGFDNTDILITNTLNASYH